MNTTETSLVNTNTAIQNQNGPVRPYFETVAPWPAPVEGHALLDALVRELTRFVVFPKWAAETFALWTIHTYCFHLRSICTYIAVESPDKECGKSTLLNVLAAFVNRPVVSSNISSSAFYRLIEEFTPTLLIDEADTNLRGSDELRGILNAGYFKPNAFVWRIAYDMPTTNGRMGIQGISDTEDEIRNTQHAIRATKPSAALTSPRPSTPPAQAGSYLARFTCWCPKVIASIGRVHETLASRCIVIPMQRKTKDEACERLKFLDAIELKRQCARFALDNAEGIAKAQPAIPEGLTNRAADVWEPLLAIADLAGGDWPQRARDAALGLTARSQGTSPIAALLLDIMVCLIKDKSERAFSRDIVARLNYLHDRPWAELRKAKLVDETWLARQLRPYGVRPMILRNGEERPRGYTMEQLRETFRRYIPRADAEAFRNELREELSQETAAQSIPDSAPNASLPPPALPAADSAPRNPGTSVPESCLECGAALPAGPVGGPRLSTHCPSCGTSIPGPSGCSFPEVCLQCGADQPRLRLQRQSPIEHLRPMPRRPATAQPKITNPLAADSMLGRLPKFREMYGPVAQMAAFPISDTNH